MLRNSAPSSSMRQQRWLRIIPVALIMYTISYIDRTNVSLALDPNISSMMKDLLMDDRMKGEAAGIFFFGYLLLQIPGGYWASRWSARKLISLCLVAWGVCAVGCGLSQSFRQFEVMRFFLGVAESAVFPATLVLLANWFPRAERARANNGWNLCQPLAVAGSAPFTGWLLGAYGWRQMLMLEGLLPFLLLPHLVVLHPRPSARGEMDFRRGKGIISKPRCKRKSDELRAAARNFLVRAPGAAVAVCHGRAVFSAQLRGLRLHDVFHHRPQRPGLQRAAIRHPVRRALRRDRRGDGAQLLAFGQDTRTPRPRGGGLFPERHEPDFERGVEQHFWISYAFLCLAIPGPFAAMAPFWAIPGETLPRSVMGVVMAWSTPSATSAASPDRTSSAG